jgi:hypothetical protein
VSSPGRALNSKAALTRGFYHRVRAAFHGGSVAGRRGFMESALDLGR